MHKPILLIFIMIIIVSILFTITIYLSNFIIKNIEIKRTPIEVGSVPSQILFDDENMNLYVSNLQSHTVSVIKIRSNFQINNLMTGKSPYGLMHDKITDQVYISNFNSNDIYIYDDENFELIDKISVGEGPTSIITLNGYIYVTNFKNNTISIINLNHFFKVTNIEVGVNPIDLIAVTDLGPTKGDDRIYIVNKGSNNIAVINPLTHKLITNITTEKEPFTIEYDSKFKTLYIANYASKSISVIDPEKNVKKYNLNLSYYPTDLIYNKNNNFLYVSENFENKSGYIHAINVTGDKLNDLKFKVERVPERLALDSANGILYISNPYNGSISIFDTNRNKEIIKTELNFNYELFFLLIDIVLLLSINVILLIIIYYHFKNITRQTSKKETKDIVFTSMLSLVIIPIVIVICNYTFSEIADIFTETGFPHFEILRWLEYLNYILYGLAAVIFFIYPPYPFFFSYFFKNYFSNIGEDIAVIEYTYFKYYYISLALLTLFFVTPIIYLQNEVQLLIQFVPIDESLIENILENPNWKMVHGIMLIIFVISSFKLLLIRHILIKKYKLRLIYARGWLKIAIYNHNDEIVELKYLIKCLSTYNRYIEDNFNLYINKLDSIFSQLSKIKKPEKDEFINGLSNIFISNKNSKTALVDIDELSPARFLANWSDLFKSEQFLVKKSFTASIRSYIETIGITIPILIGIIEVYFRLGGRV